MQAKHEFTRYEVARILGARALQIAMDAPLLMKISDDELNEMKYDSIKIAEKELNSGVLPISINRPLPQLKGDKLRKIKEDKVADDKIIEKEKEIEEEISEKAGEMGFRNADDDESNEGSSKGNR